MAKTKENAKSRLPAARPDLVEGFEEFDRLCEEGKVPSGGWCRCCERYACGVSAGAPEGVNHT